MSFFNCHFCCIKADHNLVHELSFQRKAVQAFHMQWTQENIANSGEDSSVVAAGSAPSTSLPKRNIDVTSSVEPRDSEDKDTDDHPKPYMFLII